MNPETDGCLEGRWVREVGDDLAVRFAGRVLNDLGARVEVVRPTAAGTSTERVTPRDAREAVGRHLDRDKVITTPAAMAATSPAITILGQGHDLGEGDAGDTPAVAVHITPFGMTGPKRDYRATELILFHACGLGYVTPRAQPGLKGEEPPRPLSCAAEVIGAYTGLHTAAAALAGYYGALTHGETYDIDLSSQEAALPILRREFAEYTYTGRVANRSGIGSWQVAPQGAKRVKDGFLALTIITDLQWARFAEAIGRPEWLEDERFATAEARFQHAEEIDDELAEWLSETKVEEAFLSFQEQGVAVAPAFTPQGVYEFQREMDDPIVAEGGPGDPGPLLRSAIRLDGARIAPHEPTDGAPRPSGNGMGAGTVPPRGDKPLRGVRVLDFAHVWAGPYAAQLLAHAGAEVIKIESEKHIDVLRMAPPHADDIQGVNRAGTWNAQNSGKRSISLNLATKEGAEIAGRLMKVSDVVIENYTPGVMDRLGVGWDVAHALNPGLVYASITGFGATGAYRSLRSYGPTVEACGGLSALTGYEGGPPRSMAGGLPDVTASLYAVIGVLGALIRRRETGRGCRVEVNQFDATVSLISEPLFRWVVEHLDSLPNGNRHPTMAPHSVYRCTGDDAWIAIACRSDADWRALCEELEQVAGDAGGADGAHDWADLARWTTPERHERVEEIDTLIEQVTRHLDADELERRLQARHVPATKSMTVKDMVEDPHLGERHAFAQVKHPEAGLETQYQHTWRFDDARTDTARSAPLLGEHTEEVFGELLGMGAEEIAELRERKILY